MPKYRVFTVPNDSKAIADVFINALLLYADSDESSDKSFGRLAYKKGEDDPSKRIPRLLEILEESISGMSNGTRQSYTNAYEDLKKYFDTRKLDASLLKLAKKLVTPNGSVGLEDKVKSN